MSARATAAALSSTSIAALAVAPARDRRTARTRIARTDDDMEAGECETLREAAALLAGAAEHRDRRELGHRSSSERIIEGPYTMHCDDSCCGVMRKAPWSFVLLLSISVSVAGPDKPDFSGRWVLENPRDPAVDIAGALTVRQSIVRTTVYGAPMKPFFRDLTIEREFTNWYVRRAIKSASSEESSQGRAR